MADLAPVLTLSSGRPVASSLKVAEHFQKRHDNVLRTIADLRSSVPQEFGALNFEETDYLDSQGKLRPFYNLSRDGFTLVVMGFTGAKALAWKLRYIEAFNGMEQELARLANGPEQPAASGGQQGAAALPEAARRLRPVLRERILASALQAARMQGTGSLEEIEALYARFCGLVAGPPAVQSGGWYAAFLDWCGQCVAKSTEAKTSSATLYAHFLRYLADVDPDALRPSQKEWGREMRARYLREKASTIYYHCVLPGAEGAVSLGQKWRWRTETTETEQ